MLRVLYKMASSKDSDSGRTVEGPVYSFIDSDNITLKQENQIKRELNRQKIGNDFINNNGLNSNSINSLNSLNNTSKPVINSDGGSSSSNRKQLNEASISRELNSRKNEVEKTESMKKLSNNILNSTNTFKAFKKPANGITKKIITRFLQWIGSGLIGADGGIFWVSFIIFIILAIFIGASGVDCSSDTAKDNPACNSINPVETKK